MGVRLRFVSTAALAAALLGVAAPPPAGAQSAPQPAATAAPSSRGNAASRDENAAIVAPLVRIGRVRARTPYCAALAGARPGIDAAIDYEYAVPVIAHDLRAFRLDSYLTKERSQRVSERDLAALWELAIAGRKQVQALRDAANAPGVDPDRRAAMLDFANALDGAKARQMMLARSLAKVVGTNAETPVRDIVNSASDQPGQAALLSRMAPPPNGPDILIPPPPYATEHGYDLADAARLEHLFTAFGAEEWIRRDLADAARHATDAMHLGGCTTP